MTANDARKAHELLDRLYSLTDLNKEQEELLRSFLPEIPKQKTLEEIAHEVYDAWIGADGNEWPDDAHGVLETWLAELHFQLKGVEVTAPAHPEFLETEADYASAPVGTVVAKDNQRPAWKPNEHWFINNNPFDNREMAGGLNPAPRRVLRWGLGE